MRQLEKIKYMHQKRQQASDTTRKQPTRKQPKAGEKKDGRSADTGNDI